MSYGRRFCCYLADLFLGCQPDPSAYEPQSLSTQTRSRPSPTSLGGCRGRARPPVFRPSTGREPLLDQILALGLCRQWTLLFPTHIDSESEPTCARPSDGPERLHGSELPEAPVPPRAQCRTRSANPRSVASTGSPTAR